MNKMDTTTWDQKSTFHPLPSWQKPHVQWRSIEWKERGFGVTSGDYKITPGITYPGSTLGRQRGIIQARLRHRLLIPESLPPFAQIICDMFTSVMDLCAVWS